MLFYFACEAAGASSARHSLRPLNFRCASHDPNLARIARRDRGGMGAFCARLITAFTVFIPPTCGEGGAKRRVGVPRQKTEPPPVTSFAPLTMCPPSPQSGRDKKERDVIARSELEEAIQSSCWGQWIAWHARTMTAQPGRAPLSQEQRASQCLAHSALLTSLILGSAGSSRPL